MKRRTASLAAVAALVLTPLLGPPARAGVSADDQASVVGTDGEARHSLTFAGYRKHNVDGASATFQLPPLPCDDDTAGVSLNLWGLSETGDFLAGMDLLLWCSEGQRQFEGHLTSSIGAFPISGELGFFDKIRFTIDPHDEGSATHQVTFRNLTRGWSQSMPTSSSIERIEISHRRMSLGGVEIPLQRMNHFKYTHVTFDDVPIGEASATRNSMRDDQDRVLIRAKPPHLNGFRLISKV